MWGSRAFPVICSWNKCTGLKSYGFSKMNIIIKIQDNKLICSYVIPIFELDYQLPVRSMLTDQMTFSQTWLSHQSQQKPTTLFISDTTNKANHSTLALFKIWKKNTRKISCVVPNTAFEKLKKTQQPVFLVTYEPEFQIL